MYQIRLAKQLVEDFAYLIGRHVTTTGLCVSTVEEIDDTPILDSTAHSKYMSAVGSLNYLVKSTRPDLANAVRALSKKMRTPTEKDLKKLGRTLTYLSLNPTLGLLFRKFSTLNFSTTWTMQAYSDSDWAGDVVSRKSISGWCIFLCNSLVAWKSRGQKCTALSSTGAEYVLSLIHI